MSGISCISGRLAREVKKDHLGPRMILPQYSNDARSVYDASPIPANLHITMVRPSASPCKGE